jgi:hypothetical protein
MKPAALQQYASSAGARRIAERLSGVDSFYNAGPDAANSIKELIKTEIEKNPELKGLHLLTRPGRTGAYYPQHDLIELGVANPAVLAHELGHAKNLRKSKLYKKLLLAANNVARINNVAAVPAMLTLRALVSDRATRDEIFNVLSGASAAVAAPGLVEEMSASIQALKSTPNKLEAVKALLPAFLTHVAASAFPVGVYQLGRHL